MNCFSIKEEVFEIIEHLTLKVGDGTMTYLYCKEG
jgi:hypothetical protein